MIRKLKIDNSAILNRTRGGNIDRNASIDVDVNALHIRPSWFDARQKRDKRIGRKEIKKKLKSRLAYFFGERKKFLLFFLSSFCSHILKESANQNHLFFFFFFLAFVLFCFVIKNVCLNHTIFFFVPFLSSSTLKFFTQFKITLRNEICALSNLEDIHFFFLTFSSI